MVNKNNKNNNTQQSPWVGIVFMVLFLVIVILIIIFGERSTYYTPGPFLPRVDRRPLFGINLF